MLEFGNKEIVDKILLKVNEEGGHLELTEELTFGKSSSIKITSIRSNGDVVYDRKGRIINGTKNSSLYSLNNKVLDSILELIKKDKFL